ncbi:MAG: hypothetical protein JWR54_787, partial [Mucilaginibacter sp.]|nr:hypothetical protein [Mucilaginibacter sp.]
MTPKIKLLVFFISLMFPITSKAQIDTLLIHNTNIFQQHLINHPTEKVHLHLDRPWYGLGDTIWFKAYTVAGEHHQLSNLSGVLYVELISEQDSVVKRLTLPVDTGTSWGNFTLPYSYKPGNYRLRAYTNWMRNDSDAYFFNQTIRVGIIDLSAEKVATKQYAPATNNSMPASRGNIDVQFLPEGGELVNGLRSKVAVKAINKDGSPATIKGIVLDNDGNEIAEWSTQHLGMGDFALIPQQAKNYKARIICADGSTFTIDLPKAKEEGFTLSLNNSNADSIYLKVAANDPLYRKSQNASFYLIGQSEGRVYYTAAAKLVNQVYTASLDKHRFPTGIAQFTLFSQSGEPLNERIVFIQNSDRLKLEVSAEKPSYAPGEKVKMGLSAKNAINTTVAGSFSVAVTDETKVPVDEPAETTILTDLLLTSDLKGHIEKPNYYFLNRSAQTDADLDLLMLTQGYRSFGWKKLLAGNEPQPVFRPETALSLSGIIKTPSNKPVANGKVRLTSVKDLFVADTLTDANGNFTFSDINLQDSTKVVINAQKADGGDNVKIYFKEHTYPLVDNNKEQINHATENIPEPLKEVMQKTYTSQQKNIRLDSLQKVRQLKEVRIEAQKADFYHPHYSSNMKMSANLNGPGNANQVLLGDKLVGCGRLSDCLRGKL